MIEIPLYRYSAFESSDDQEKVRQIVQDFTLYFTSPSSFNDPFDCKPLVSIAGGTPGQLRTLFRQGLSNVFPSIDSSKIDLLVEQMMATQNLEKMEADSSEILSALICQDTGAGRNPLPVKQNRLYNRMSPC